MKRLAIFILIFLMIMSVISGLCEDGQIDINSVSIKELDNLDGIGPVKAEAIVNSRPFDSVDDLINIYGIGEATLRKIKEQGLACVDGEKNEKKEENKEETKSKEIVYEEVNEENEKEVKIETIELNTKIIKSEENKKILDNAGYVKYGFAILCTLLGFLIILKRRKYKTEFN